MSSSTKFLIVCLCATIVGCAIPPGKLKDTDFLSMRVSLDKPTTDAIAIFYEGSRFCGSRYGVPECSPQRQDGGAVCDLYIGSPYGGRSDFVLGRIDFEPAFYGTLVALRIRTSFASLHPSGQAKRTEMLSAWTFMLEGKAAELCLDQ